jgi:ribulose-5-phosphate 4-epimerase/fuculose-1-phosphate aldolase
MCVLIIKPKVLSGPQESPCVRTLDHNLGKKTPIEPPTKKKKKTENTILEYIIKNHGLTTAHANVSHAFQ